MTWKAQTGINWPDGKGGEVRVEAGGDVPDSVVSDNAWLVADGHVTASGWTASAIPVVEIAPDPPTETPPPVEEDHANG